MAAEYIIEISEEAQVDLDVVPAFHRPRLVKALAELEHQAEVETRQRKPLAEPLEELPAATWEVRVGDFRALYQVRPADERDPQRKTVRVLRVILKGSSTTQEALDRARKR